MDSRSAWMFTRMACAAAVVCAAPALAQNTTAAIAGRVTAADGKPVAGATVTILHVASGSTNQTQTDADGRYAARGLRAGGPYTITVSKDGATDKRENVELILAETLGLNLVLGAGPQTIVVTGRANAATFNDSNVGAGTQIGSRELAALPSIARNLQDYARTDPRLSQTDKERGEISAMGMNSRYNTITVDGVNISDTFGLEANTLPTAKQPISIDAIQNVQVNISNYDVTQKGYVGANINAVTKSGTNEFHGTVSYVFRNQDFVGKRYNRAADSYYKVDPFEETLMGFTLGGPIIKDKLFFFASYEESKSNRAQPTYGPVGSALTNVAFAQSTLDQLGQIAQSQYHFDPGALYANSELSVKDYLLKLDWNITDRHRASLRYTRTEQGETNGGSFSGYSPTSLQLTSAWWTQNKTIDTVVGQWFADWTDTFSTELKLSNRNYTSIPRNNAYLPAMALRFSGPAPTGAPAGVNTGTRYLNFGTDYARQFNVLDTKTMDGYFGATWNLDDHELKFGGDLERNQVYNAYFQNTYGNYTFGCTDASAGLTYNSPLLPANFKCNSATYAQMEAAVLENFQRGRPSSYQIQVPVPGGSLDDGIAQWTLTNTGLFAQDHWKVNSRLSLSGGIRYDRMSTGQRPAYNAAAAAPTVAGSVSGNSVVRNSGGFGMNNSQTIDGASLFQPRLGFHYDFQPTADKRKMQLRGGVGLFQGAAPSVWISNPYSNTGLATLIVGCGTGGFSACPVQDGLFSADPGNQPVAPFANVNQPAANVDFLAPGLSQPSVWKANLAFDAELPWWGLVAGAEVIVTKVRSGIFYQSLNLGGSTRNAPDGREMYWTPQAYNPACWQTSGSLSTSGVCAGSRAKALSNPAFNNVMLATSNSQGGGSAVTLSLGNGNAPAFGWQVAYTYTQAKELSPLTSSVSTSNFNSRAIYNPNEAVTANSAYLIKDRVTASFNWSRAFVSKYKTSVGLFYEGRRGKPYSWTYANDMNGDSVAGNDLMYIPKGPQSGEVVFKGDTTDNHPNEDRFWAIVDGIPSLSNARGGVVPRASTFAPWVNNFDVRLSQEVPGFTSQHRGVISLDILNVGNLLNKRWGQINEVPFSSSGGMRRSFVNYGGIDSSGRYVYNVNDSVADYTLRQVKGESQWAMQLTLRYEF
ncbi:MAG: TonB-dependent receptor [Burkholderiales bacterium]|nr:TonB-dependent receptor [Burkholderiales bacterium]